MKRRQFITLLGGVAVVRPLAARAQQGERVRRIGVLMPQAESDPEQQSWTTAFTIRLRELGWRQGENAQIDYRWTDLPVQQPTKFEFVIKAPRTIAGFGDSALAERTSAGLVPR